MSDEIQRYFISERGHLTASRIGALGYHKDYLAALAAQAEEHRKILINNDNDWAKGEARRKRALEAKHAAELAEKNEELERIKRKYCGQEESEITRLRAELAALRGKGEPAIMVLAEALAAAQELARVADSIIQPQLSSMRKYRDLQRTAVWKSTQAAAAVGSDDA